MVEAILDPLAGDDFEVVEELFDGRTFGGSTRVATGSLVSLNMQGPSALSLRRWRKSHQSKRLMILPSFNLVVCVPVGLGTG